MILANCSNWTQPAGNLSIMYLGNSLSQFCPLTRQMSFTINRVHTVNGPTRTIGSFTFDSRRKTKRSVKLSVMVLLVPLLTTKAPLLLSHLRACSYIGSSLVDSSFCRLRGPNNSTIQIWQIAYKLSKLERTWTEKMYHFL